MIRKNRTGRKRWLSLALMIALVVSLMPSNTLSLKVFAEEAETGQEMQQEAETQVGGGGWRHSVRGGNTVED